MTCTLGLPVYIPISTLIGQLNGIVKRRVAESVPDGASVHTSNAAFEAVSALNQNCSAPLLKVERSVSDSFLKRAEYTKIALEPQGVDFGIFTDRDQRSILGGFEFRESVFFGYWSPLLYFLGC